MRIPKQLVAVLVFGVAALAATNIIEALSPQSAHAASIVLVVIGTILVGVMRAGLWPRPARNPSEPAESSGAAPSKSSNTQVSRRRQIRWAIVILFVWLLFLVSAFVLGSSYSDADSRLFALQAIARVSAVITSLLILFLPKFDKTSKDGAVLSLWLLLFGALLAGSVFLPLLSRLVWSSSFGIENFVKAVPGWSFVPVAAFFLRGIYYRFVSRPL